MKLLKAVLSWFKKLEIVATDVSYDCQVSDYIFTFSWVSSGEPYSSDIRVLAQALIISKIWECYEHLRQIHKAADGYYTGRLSIPAKVQEVIDRLRESRIYLAHPFMLGYDPKADRYHLQRGTEIIQTQLKQLHHAYMEKIEPGSWCNGME